MPLNLKFGLLTCNNPEEASLFLQTWQHLYFNYKVMSVKYLQPNYFLGKHMRQYFTHHQNGLCDETGKKLLSCAEILFSVSLTICSPLPQIPPQESWEVQDWGGQFGHQVAVYISKCAQIYPPVPCYLHTHKHPQLAIVLTGENS